MQYPQFHRMVEKLKPGYALPARQEIADKLPMVYEEEYRKCTDDLKNENMPFMRWMVKHSH